MEKEPNFIFDILEKIAAESPFRRARLASALVYKGRIIAIGTNQLISHPFQKIWGTTERNIYFHSETRTIFNALRDFSPSIFPKCSLYICRVKYLNARKLDIISGISRPCSGCTRCIAHYQIPNIFYTLDGNSKYRRQFACLTN